MFNNNSLEMIQSVVGTGDKKKKKKTKTKISGNTVIVEPDSEDLAIYKEMMVQGARWGMYLAHRESTMESRVSMLKGLWKKNRPDEEMPNEIFSEEVCESIDSDSGKCFAELCEEAMINDWANSPNTIPTIEKLENIAGSCRPDHFMKAVTECVEKMKENYKQALQMQVESKRIN